MKRDSPVPITIQMVTKKPLKKVARKQEDSEKISEKEGYENESWHGTTRVPEGMVAQFNIESGDV